VGGRKEEKAMYISSVFPSFVHIKNEGWRIKTEADDYAKAEGRRRSGRTIHEGTVAGFARRHCENTCNWTFQPRWASPSRPLCKPPALSLPLSPSLSPSVLRRSPFTPPPSNSPSGLLPLSLVSPRFDLSFFRRSVLFLSRLSRPYSGGPVLSLSSSAATPACLPSPFSLLSRRPCSRAVPLYLPPPFPVVPSSLKAVESNQWHIHIQREREREKKRERERERLFTALQCQCIGATAMVVVVVIVVVVWRPPESIVSSLNLLSFPLFSAVPFFPFRYSARNPRVGFAEPGKYAPDKGNPPAVEFLSLPLSLSLSLSPLLSLSLSFSLQRLPKALATIISFRRRTWRFYRRGGISIPSTGRRAGKCPADFSIGLSAE